MLPPKLLDTCKVVLVARNPRDCCVSFYNHDRMSPNQGFQADFPEFAQMFREGNTMYGDYWYHLEVGKSIYAYVFDL